MDFLNSSWLRLALGLTGACGVAFAGGGLPSDPYGLESFISTYPVSAAIQNETWQHYQGGADGNFGELRFAGISGESDRVDFLHSPLVRDQESNLDTGTAKGVQVDLHAFFWHRVQGRIDVNDAEKKAKLEEAIQGSMLQAKHVFFQLLARCPQMARQSKQASELLGNGLYSCSGGAAAGLVEAFSDALAWDAKLKDKGSPYNLLEVGPLLGKLEQRSDGSFVGGENFLMKLYGFNGYACDVNPETGSKSCQITFDTIPRQPERDLDLALGTGPRKWQDSPNAPVVADLRGAKFVAQTTSAAELAPDVGPALERVILEDAKKKNAH